MSDLLGLVKAFDMPRRWDGLAVVWTPWGSDRSFACPPPKPEPCKSCGLIRPRATSNGRVALRPDTTHKEVMHAAHAPRRYATKSGIAEAVAHLRLFASRCTECGHDEVYDSLTGESWNLDWRDYQAGGSNP